MLVQDVINLINLEADELLDEDADNIPYINSAIDYLSFTLAGLGSSDCMTTLQVVSGLSVPSNFIEFVPKNGYPVYISGDVFYTNTGNPVNIKYSVAQPHVSLITDTIPFKDMYISTLVLIASYMIKKKTYIPVEYTNSDKAFVSDVLTSIKAAKGVN
jgi:hypothetical protein